jgi:hypothetical protein
MYHFYPSKSVDTNVRSGETSIANLILRGLDLIFPIINSVTLNTTTLNAGGEILVTVNATDDVAVTDVEAYSGYDVGNFVVGTSLIYQGKNIWNGTINAIEDVHSVNVSARDAAGNIAWNNSTGYNARKISTLASISVLPTIAKLTTGETQLFNATARDQDGNPISGIGISWISTNMTVGNVTQLNAITGSDGNVSAAFTGIEAGTVTLNATNGTVIGSAVVVVTSSISKLNGSISGYEINDTNDNGKWDAGEKGLSGWNVTLISNKGDNKNGNVVRKETTTDAAGFYSFDDLPAGKYTLREKLEKGFEATSSPVKNIKLAKDENSMNNNFTNMPAQRRIRDGKTGAME